MPTSKIRVMSYNIRVPGDTDGPANAWERRRSEVAKVMIDFNPDFIGVQELYNAEWRSYLHDKLTEGLARKYKTVSHGIFADDARDMEGLFYDKDKFQKLRSGNIWFSSDPNRIGSQGWACGPEQQRPKIMNWGRFKDLSNPNDKDLFVVNVHFDNWSAHARLHSAQLLIEVLGSKSRDCRRIVMGDFNCADSDGSKAPYFVLTGAARLQDAYREKNAPADNEGTQAKNFRIAERGRRIDWILASKQWTVHEASIDRTARDGRAPSDHCAVKAVLLSEY